MFRFLLPSHCLYSSLLVSLWCDFVLNSSHVKSFCLILTSASVGRIELSLTLCSSLSCVVVWCVMQSSLIVMSSGGVSIPTDAMDGVVNALRLMDLDSILPPKTISTTLTTPITELTQLLSKHNILNAPVVSATNEFIGFIGMNELVEFVTSIVPQPTTWAYNADAKDINLSAWNTATVKTVLDSVTKRDGYAITCPKVLVRSTAGTTAGSGGAAAAAEAPTGLNVWQIFELMASRNLRRNRHSKYDHSSVG